MVTKTAVADPASAEKAGTGADSTDVLAPRRRRRVRLVVASVVFAVLLMPVWSFTRAVAVSNGDPFSANATEWARGHSLGWRSMHWWYSHHQPPKGGTPKRGIAGVAPTAVHPAVHSSGGSAVGQSVCPLRVPSFASSTLAGERVWQTVGRSKGAACFAYLRPDVVHTSVLVAVAWMNMSVLTATLHNGTAIPGGGHGGPDR